MIAPLEGRQHKHKLQQQKRVFEQKKIDSHFGWLEGLKNFRGQMASQYFLDDIFS